MDSRFKDERNTRMRDRDETKEGRSGSPGRFTCPICERSVALSMEGHAGLPRFFPFCSERCKLIDLGAWLDADYRIPAKPEEESEDALEPSPEIDL